MALITNEDGSPIPKKQEPKVRITEPKYKSVTVDTRYTPINSLMTVMEGGSWVVDYYSQVIDDDDELTGLMTNTSAVYQQYHLIKNLELKVDNALSSSQDQESKGFDVTGSAHIHPSVIPNVGDMFIADIGDGRGGIFKITSSTSKSFFKDTVHYVEYILISYDSDFRKNNLTSKTIKTTYYVKDFNYYGQNPLIETEDYNNIRQLKTIYPRIVKEYFDLFFSNEFQTMLVPNVGTSIYDPFMIRMIKTIFDTNEHRFLQFVNSLNVSLDKTLNVSSIWDALINKDKLILNNAFKQYNLISVKSFSSNPYFQSIYYSRINSVIYPTDVKTNVDYKFEPKLILDYPIILVDDNYDENHFNNYLDAIDYKNLPYTSNRIIDSINYYGYYVLSPEFYGNEGELSKFESAVKDYMNGKHVDLKLLVVFTKILQALHERDRFYYTPIVIMMIKSALKGS